MPFFTLLSVALTSVFSVFIPSEPAGHIFTPPEKTETVTELFEITDEYVIVISENASAAEITAANLLKDTFNAINGTLSEDQTTEHRNVYHGDNGKIDIEVSTVHAVKGETHAATLYLETFYNRHHESDRLAEQFKGVAYAGTDADTLKNLRVAYVGMSRPRYMLCVAIQQDRFDKIDCEALRRIWEVEKA